MSEFLQECYAAGGEPEIVRLTSERADAAAAELTAAGTPIRLVRSIFLPDDETFFLLWEAGAEEIVSEAARRAGLVGDRISRTLPLGAPAPRQPRNKQQR